jgi:hypothetical protein
MISLVNQCRKHGGLLHPFYWAAFICEGGIEIAVPPIIAKSPALIPEKPEPPKPGPVKSGNPEKPIAGVIPVLPPKPKQPDKPTDLHTTPTVPDRAGSISVTRQKDVNSPNARRFLFGFAQLLFWGVIVFIFLVKIGFISGNYVPSFYPAMLRPAKTVNAPVVADLGSGNGSIKDDIGRNSNETSGNEGENNDMHITGLPDIQPDEGSETPTEQPLVPIDEEFATTFVNNWKAMLEGCQLGDLEYYYDPAVFTGVNVLTNLVTRKNYDEWKQGFENACSRGVDIHIGIENLRLLNQDSVNPQIQFNFSMAMGNQSTSGLRTMTLEVRGEDVFIIAEEFQQSVSLLEH